MDLSIIIPAYKEGELFAKSLETLAAWLKDRDYGEVEVVVMSDGDASSGQIAETKRPLFKHLKVLYAPERMGKGGGVRQAMFEATGRYKLFMDADLATPLVHLDEVYALMQQKVDVAIAVRNLFKIHKGLMRKLMSKFSNLAAQILLLPGIPDTQCGFKLFSQTAAQEIFSRQTMTSWSFDMEILAIAKKLGYKIHYIRANDWKDPKAVGLVGDSMFGIVLKGFLDPFKIRWNLIRGRYKKGNFKYVPFSTQPN